MCIRDRVTTGGLPEGERERWRVLFDHYVFRADGDPAAHLPAEARGVLGPASAAVLDPIKRRLAASL